MNTKQLIFTLSMIVLIITMTLYGLHITETADTRPHTVPCYDRYQNQIQDLTCISNEVVYSQSEVLIFTLLLLSVLILIVALPVIVPALGDYDKEAYF